MIFLNLSIHNKIDVVAYSVNPVIKDLDQNEKKRSVCLFNQLIMKYENQSDFYL
jgi:hypothetical protein